MCMYVHVYMYMYMHYYMYYTTHGPLYTSTMEDKPSLRMPLIISISILSC